MSNTPTLIAVGGTLIGVLVTGGFGLLLDGRRRRSEERRYVHEQNERRREEKNRLYVEYLTVLQETHDYLLANYRVERPPAPDLAELSPLARVERHLRLVAPTPVVEMARRMYQFASHLVLGVPERSGVSSRDQLLNFLEGGSMDRLMRADLTGMSDTDLRLVLQQQAQVSGHPRSAHG